MLVKKKRSQIIFRWLFAKPARAIFFSFLSIVFIGTILLMLPVASQDGQSVGLVGALFTAVSATCVTGLVLYDTATQFSAMGQTVIAFLIQIGGLGLVTIATFFLSMIRRKFGLKTMVLAQQSSGSFSMLEMKKLLRSIVLMTLTFELVGFLFFLTHLVPIYGWKSGAAKSAFHAVSSFCNAGFDILGDTAAGPFSSLTTFNDRPLFLLVTAFLVISGGLGFIVWHDLFHFKTTRKLRVHTRFMLTATGICIVVGMVFFLVFEWQNLADGAMGQLPAWQRPMAAFFQSVTTRTAGFNTLSMSSMHESSRMLSIALMFIGAGSASTAGGIKLTTIGLIVAAVMAELAGRDEILLRRHLIPREAVRRALAVFFIGMSVVLILTMIFCLTEMSSLIAGNVSFLDLLFEATSAFGTVGLSAVSTPTLSTTSHIFMIPAMFIGRIGPITFAVSLALRGTQPVSNVYPEGRLHIG